MNITHYTARQARGELFDEFGIVTDDASAAIRVCVRDIAGKTAISSDAAYKGENLTFNNGGDLSDPRNDYAPVDSQGRSLRVEISPPISDGDLRQHAASVFAAAVFDASRSGELLALPGEEIAIRLR